MTHTKQIIQDAIEGGWKGHEKHGDHPNIVQLLADNPDMVAEFLLDPSFWQAVEKTRKWREGEPCLIDGKEGWHSTTWDCKAGEFFQNVMAGDNYETALSKLSN